jgi:hypothetical protein
MLIIIYWCTVYCMYGFWFFVRAAGKKDEGLFCIFKFELEFGREFGVPSLEFGKKQQISRNQMFRY